MSGALRVSRWTRHGHDRLYVSTGDGAKVGWVDLRTGRQQLQLPLLADDFQAAVDRWQATRSPAPVDLAGQQAGAALRERAAELRPARGLGLLARLFRVRTADYSWRVGAEGERVVGGRLDKLAPAGWHVLHGVQLGMGGDVDHVLIGPAGVFTVNTKHHPGARVEVGERVVFVRGKAQPYVGKACREARRVRDALISAYGGPVHVGPLIVMHGHRSLSGWVKRRPQGVQVLPSWAVRTWFRIPGRANLAADQVQTLYALARQPATWKHV